MKAIIGLGNPGKKYNCTRHNAGFEILDHLLAAKFAGLEFKKNDRLFSETALVKEVDQQILLVKPQTYMNESGKAFLAVKNWYKLSLKDILVIHDDVSLPLAKIRLQKAGGAGGQHGIESIIKTLGGENGFNRLKIGIGPDPGGALRADYVLQKFSNTEKELLTKVSNLNIEVIEAWLHQGIEEAMNKFNGFDILSAETELKFKNNAST